MNLKGASRNLRGLLALKAWAPSDESEGARRRLRGLLALKAWAPLDESEGARRRRLRGLWP